MNRQTAQRIRYAVSLPARITLAFIWLITVAIARVSNRAELILDDIAENLKTWTA